MFSFSSKKRIYLDHASTTPIDKGVLRAMNEVYKNNYYNPGALYAEGVSVSRIILESRTLVAKILGTTNEHIVFMRGGTESNNLALMGTVQKFKELYSDVTPHIIISEIEHSAVLETAKHLAEKKEIELAIIPVDEEGIVDVSEIKKALRPETILVSVMYVNNEIGTVQPIKEIAKLVRWYKKQKLQEENSGLKGLMAASKNKGQVYPLFHTDAIQATNYLEIGVEQLGVDLMSLSGSKIYGPKSSGVLYVRDRKLVGPMVFGGEQEFGLRAGTEDVASIVGFAKALEIARGMSEAENNRLSELQKYFYGELEKNISGMKINGAWNTDSLNSARWEHTSSSETKTKGASSLEFESRDGFKKESGLRVCNNINISIQGISSERLVIELDAKGICAASKSACREESDEESYVIAALRKAQNSSSKTTEGSIRFTMGRGTTKGDVDKAVFALQAIVKAIRTFEAILSVKEPI